LAEKIPTVEREEEIGKHCKIRATAGEAQIKVNEKNPLFTLDSSTGDESDYFLVHLSCFNSIVRRTEFFRRSMLRVLGNFGSLFHIIQFLVFYLYVW